MSKLNFFLSLDALDICELKECFESYLLDGEELYKLDIVDNETNFLQANANELDLEFNECIHLPSNKSLQKNITFLRGIQESKIIEFHENFLLICALSKDDECEQFCPFSSIERLKIFMLFGLSSKDFGIDTYTALRLFAFYLYKQNKVKKLARLIELFAEFFDEEIAKKLINSKNLIDYESFIKDSEGFFWAKNEQFCRTLARKIRRVAIIFARYKKGKKNLKILLNFLAFFHKNKQLRLKDKNICQSASKIAKMCKKFT